MGKYGKVVRKGGKIFLKRTKAQVRAVKARVRRGVKVLSPLQPIPARQICKMKYSEVITTDAAGNYAFNLNSVWDPNRTGAGHQPYGRDTLATLYNRYRVISCGWRIVAVSTVASAAYQVAAQPANEVLTPPTFDEMKENPRTKYGMAIQGARPCIISGKSYLPALYGRTKSQMMSDDRYQAQVDASPAELAILNIKTATVAGDITFQILNVLLEYTVEWFDPKHLVQS